MMHRFIRYVGQLLLLTLLLGAGCRLAEPQETAVEPLPTLPAAMPEQAAVSEQAAARSRDFLVVATDAPLPPFTRFDEFGNVEGFNASVMESLAAAAGFDYEFVVTPFQGVLDLMASADSNEFNVVMSSLLIPETPREGIAYSAPYLEVGQVLVVLADNETLQSYRDVRPGMVIGVQDGSSGEQVARQALRIGEDDLIDEYQRPAQVVQALIDETVDAIILDSYSADYFTLSFPEQLKVVGGGGRDAWITSKSYGMAVAARDTELLERLNAAIVQLQREEAITRLTVTWLILEDPAAAAIDPGESRVGTPASEFFIGMVGQLSDMDPASLLPDLIGWEVKRNTMSGLYGFTADNELVPVLASGPPEISEDKLEYTISLKPGLLFTDGRELTAEEVKWSLNRAARLGNFLVNNYLKDSNEDNFADEDAVQVIDPLTVKIILNEPAAFFPSLLAIPPYYPISSACFAETADPGSVCGGIGPYTIVSWTPNERMRLKANLQWPGESKPAFDNITLRFYADAAEMRRSLADFQSLDLAWSGLPYSDLLELQALDLDGDGGSDFKAWEGPAIFKSYLIFEQSEPPWNNRRVRQAAALSLDREALAQEVFGGLRRPLLSPVPDDVPGHTPVLPARDLEQARALMLEVGYTPENPLPITLWYVNDGRYSAVEAQYANAIRSQLEESGVFQVTLESAPWEQFRVQIAQCAYPAYLIGWPSPGQPTNYLDPSSWTNFFVQNTDRVFCSNYASREMDELVTAANQEIDPAARLELFAQIQQLWASELPTLDITQEPRYALSLAKVDNVRVDALGLLHYEYLTKRGR